MGCQDGFHDASFVTKIALFIVLLAMFASWLAFCTTSWLVQDIGGTDVYFGLWRICQRTPTGSSLGSCVQTDGTTNIKYGVTQAFAILGFMCLNFGSLAQLLFIFWGKFQGNYEAGMTASMLFFISGLMWLIAVAVFGGTWENWSGDFHYSFGLAVVAAGLAILAGIFQSVGSRNGGQVGCN